MYIFKVFSIQHNSMFRTILRFFPLDIGIDWSLQIAGVFVFMLRQPYS